MYDEPVLIKKKNHNKKPLMLVFTIIMFLGISLAAVYFVSNQSDTRVNKLVSGLIDIEFTNQTENIYLSEDKAVPMLDALGKQNPPYEFTVKNISKVPIRVYIALDIKSITINKSALRYALYINDEEITTSDLSKLDENNNLYILENLDPDESVTGKIVFWIDYYYENTNESFDATIKVTGESKDYIYEEKTYATDVLKEKLGTDGLIGVTNDNQKVEIVEGGDIREYRYSGAEANNYVYFNCQEGKDQNEENCEKWRIIGIFKGDDGQDHMKIIRNEFLTTEMPATYQAEGKTFQINSSNYGRWDYDGSSYDNNWSNAGLMYWLNSKGTDSNDVGYLKKLTSEAQNMIYETTWYLGNFKYNQDTTITGYASERDASNIHSGNPATWKGKIALMYPSDMGFSTDSSYWNTNMYNFNSTQVNTTWLKEGHTYYEWFLSPSSFGSSIVANWISGNVGGVGADYSRGVRPVLYLKSDTSIKGGEGTSTTPYTLKG